MNILVACEETGIVRDALIARGHRAVSCDLKPSQRPGPHLQDDVRNWLNYRWDMLIAHPVCRRLSNAGVRWLHERPELWQEMLDGVEFFKLFIGPAVQHIPKRCVENPIMHRHAFERIGRRADQFVHPWWFGSPFQKATGLFLDGLPPLPREFTKAWYAAHGVTIEQAVWKMPPSDDREQKRSETDPQVARAMAQYWGVL
jgi:hypothetical protein